MTIVQSPFRTPNYRHVLMDGKGLANQTIGNEHVPARSPSALELSVTEKEHIRQEEIFRQEVRKQLGAQGAPEKEKRIWRFLNSGLGLWLLSSVVITGFTFVYSSWDKNEQERRSQRSERRRVETES